MSRRAAREVAMKIAFARLCGGDAECKDVVEMSPTEEEVNETDFEYASSLANGVRAHSDELDVIITEYARNWSIERLPRVELVILRMAVYELIYNSAVPTGAVINEAVSLSKLYCDSQAYQYINGILGAYVRREDLPSGDIEA